MANRKTIAILAVLSMIMISMAAVFAAEDSSAAFDVQRADMGDDKIEIKPESTASFDVILTSKETNDVIISMTSKIVDGAGNTAADISSAVSLKGSDDKYAVLSTDDKATFIISVSTDRFVAKGDYSLVYTYTVTDMGKNPLGDPVSVTKAIVVLSTSNSDGMFNKFVGVFDNNLDGMLSEAWFTAVASFLIVLGIGIIASLIVAPVISILMTTRDSPDRKPLRKSLTKVFIFTFAVVGVARSMAIYGIEGKDLATVNDLARLIYILVGAFIVWKIYATFLDRIADRIRSHGSKDSLDNYMSFKPLFAYLGKIIVVLGTLFTIMAMFGVDMAAIITSAGLITMGITFGAQQILAQFFAGLLILSTRPFKKGDLIQLGSDVVYRVRKVNVMNTELENWDNSDITIVPNNTITGSKVKNITRDTLHTKLYVFVGVGYGTDLNFARNLMVEAAKEHPRIIQNGAAPAPSTSLIDFQDSNILLRLNIWVDDYNVALGVGSDLRTKMFEKFNAAGISIDYPQVVLHTADKE